MSVSSDSSLDTLTDSVVLETHNLIALSRKNRNHRERANRRRVARLFNNAPAIGITMALTDEVMRINSSKAATRILRSVARKVSISGFGLLDAFGIFVISPLSRIFPNQVIRIVHQRIRFNSRDLILSANPKYLSKYVANRKSQGVALNINVLGEAVLGHAEANLRFQSIIEMIRRPEVNYISVKLSAIVAQLVTIDIDGSQYRSGEKLRELYRIAAQHKVFVNLDMEEYRDLEMTVAAFMEVLDESEFNRISAGIVLQAYLPESHRVLDQLISWSKDRHLKHGSHIKIRLVKGANLAMERAEAELHGWDAAPFSTKADVDASFLRLIDVALRPENSQAIRIGIASHNLFHLAWTLAVANQRGVREQIDIEMLEGMANGESLALVSTGQVVLLYAPVTKDEDFSAAVAYLVRRLDENTSPENYLRASFEMEKHPDLFYEQEKRFRSAVQHRHTLALNSRRHVSTSDSTIVNRNFEEFSNHPDADPTEPGFQKDLSISIARVTTIEDMQIPAVVAGEVIFTGEKVAGYDPSDEAKNWYHYTVGMRSQVDRAVDCAKTAHKNWNSISRLERLEILHSVAQVMDMKKCETIAIMMRDAGKTAMEAIPEISEAIDFANYYGISAGDFNGSEPLGTVLVVPPWNFPYAIPVGGICAALAAGNTVILKPAPETVATAFELVNHFWDGGVPREVLQFLPMRDDDDGKYLVTHPGIDAVILTGAFSTAQLFKSWRPELNLIAETSGKNALLITASADIDVAVKDLVQSAFGHAGQKCSAASLAIVESSIYRDPAFFRQLKDAVQSLSVGVSWKLATTVGPIIRAPEAALLRALKFLDDGEEWLIEPKQCDSAGLLWKPGVKIGVKAGSWSHHNEWFGPVLAILEAPDFSTGLKWQNQTDFGLTAGIQSLDQGECETWIQSLEAGNLYVNRGTTGAIVNRQPFGGWKRSSVGPNAKAGGPNYVNVLRKWNPVTDVKASKLDVDAWWQQTGSNAIDHSRLTVEKNFQRYRRYLKPILVVVDKKTTATEIEMLHYICSVTGAPFEITEDIAKVIGDYSKVRWLAATLPPTLDLLARGISVDHRRIAQRGDIEAPRWLLEQSVSITFHRYGNVSGGPKPVVLGL